jgi:hypothetical protein
VDLQNNTKVQCLVCGEDFTKKNSRMLSHLGYIPSTGAWDSNVKLCKNVKLNVLRAFHGCGSVAPTPPEPAKLQHLQGSTESEEPICQGTQSSTMHASCGASQNLAAACGPIWNSSGTASQLQPSTGPSSARSLQQSSIPVLNVEDQRPGLWRGRWRTDERMVGRWLLSRPWLGRTVASVMKLPRGKTLAFFFFFFFF